MKTKVWLFGIASMLSSSALAAWELDWDWMVSGQSTHHRESVLLLSKERSSTQSVNALLDVQVSKENWTGLFAIHGSDILTNDDAVSFDADFIVQELFWQSSVALSGVSFEATLGKTRLDWGVGYGYRPLDIFKPYRRNPVGIQVEEGAGVVMASYFDANGEWALLYTNSHLTQQQGNKLEEEAQQQGVGIRRYVFMGNTEWQGLAYFDDVRKGLVGGSVVSVFDDSWEVHGSATYQRSYKSYQQGDLHQPVTLDDQSNGVQALVGVNWANSTGNNVIVEYWYDSRSWDASDWENAINKSQHLTNDESTQGLAGSYALGFTHTNLVQHNIMLHWSLDSSAWSQWGWSQNIDWLGDVTPKLDVLVSPQDGGVIATQWLNYQVYDSGQSAIEMEVAARFLTGDSGSAYANLSDKHMILFNLKGKF